VQSELIWLFTLKALIGLSDGRVWGVEVAYILPAVFCTGYYRYFGNKFL
jgi:hypothetical protein